MAKTAAAGTVDAIVLVGLYAWHEKFGDTSATVNEAHKGDEINVSKDEFDRGNSMVPMALAKKDSKEARRFLAGELPTNASHFAELSDDELRAVVALRGIADPSDMNRDELLGAILNPPQARS